MDKTAAHGQITAQACGGRTDAHLIAALQRKRRVKRRLHALAISRQHLDRRLSTGNRYHGLALTGKRQATHENFQTSSARLVAYCAIGRTQCAAIQRA